MFIALIQRQGVDLLVDDEVDHCAEEVDLRVEEEFDLLQGGHILEGVVENDVVMSLQRIGWERENLRGFGGEQVLLENCNKLCLAINRLLAFRLSHLLPVFSLLLAFHLRFIHLLHLVELLFQLEPLHRLLVIG